MFKPLIGQVRQPLPARPGAVERSDHVYGRNGVASLFMAREPLAGWPHVAINAQRRRADRAGLVRAAGGALPRRRAHGVCEGPAQPHALASLYEAFPPAQARRLAGRPAGRIELHHTPKHGWWLDRAEIEPAALGRRCLARRVARPDTLSRQIARWQEPRNQAQAKVDRQFTTDGTRIGLRTLHPSNQT